MFASNKIFPISASNKILPIESFVPVLPDSHSPKEDSIKPFVPVLPDTHSPNEDLYPLLVSPVLPQSSSNVAAASALQNPHHKVPPVLIPTSGFILPPSPPLESCITANKAGATLVSPPGLKVPLDSIPKHDARPRYNSSLALWQPTTPKYVHSKTLSPKDPGSRGMPYFRSP